MMPDSSSQISPGIRPRKLITILLSATSASVFLTYLIPQWYSFFTSRAFVFTNGWDEEVYMSWQGVLAWKGAVGTHSLHLSWLMHLIGISGAVQNLLLDTLLPPLTALLVYLSLRRYDFSSAVAVGYAVLICFGSVLFNANNPLISAQLGQTRSATIWFMSAWEVYPSILRTPNPEISFFLIAAAVYGYARFRKWWLCCFHFRYCISLQPLRTALSSLRVSPTYSFGGAFSSVGAQLLCIPGSLHSWPRVSGCWRCRG